MLALLSNKNPVFKSQVSLSKASYLRDMLGNWKLGKEPHGRNICFLCKESGVHLSVSSLGCGLTESFSPLAPSIWCLLGAVTSLTLHRKREPDRQVPTHVPTHKYTYCTHRPTQKRERWLEKGTKPRSYTSENKLIHLSVSLSISAVCF